jgi:bifunctional DNA-binding transcriptional regulator/antitoxin component of YhaV-PrlF toxin-antitoxin module
MRNSNIVKVDSKGRILIPIHIRKFLSAEEGTEIIIIPDREKGQAKVLPLLKEKTAEFRFMIDDLPGSLAKIADILSDYGLNIIMSESRTLVKGKVAEWDVIVDTSESNGTIEQMKKDMQHSKIIKGMEVLR